MTHNNLVQQARSLRSDQGSNAEYDRALVELVMYATGGTSDDLDAFREQVLNQPWNAPVSIPVAQTDPDTTDPRICTGIGAGAYDHMLDAMADAIQHRKRMQQPWDALSEIQTIVGTVWASRDKPVSVRANEGPSLTRQLKGLRDHPNEAVRLLAKQAMLMVFTELLDLTPEAAASLEI